MNPNEWTTRDWILRGLVMTCISSCDLHRWYAQRTPDPDPVNVFDDVVADLVDEGLVYVQRTVPCRTCDIGHRVPGFALTEAGKAAEPLAERMSR